MDHQTLRNHIVDHVHPDWLALPGVMLSKARQSRIGRRTLAHQLAVFFPRIMATEALDTQLVPSLLNHVVHFSQAQWERIAFEIGVHMHGDVIRRIVFKPEILRLKDKLGEVMYERIFTDATFLTWPERAQENQLGKSFWQESLSACGASLLIRQLTPLWGDYVDLIRSQFPPSIDATSAHIVGTLDADAFAHWLTTQHPVPQVSEAQE